MKALPEEEDMHAYPGRSLLRPCFHQQQDIVVKGISLKPLIEIMIDILDTS